MSYYDVGDEVVYTPLNTGAKIIRALPNDEYVVEFEDKGLIPPQMTIPGQYLAPKLVPSLFGGYSVGHYDSDYTGYYGDGGDSSYHSNNKETNCPKCGGLWKQTDIGHKIYFDCLKCNLKKEDA